MGGNKWGEERDDFVVLQATRLVAVVQCVQIGEGMEMLEDHLALRPEKAGGPFSMGGFFYQNFKIIGCELCVGGVLTW